MKAIFIFIFAVSFFGCYNNTTTYTTHEIVIAPHTLTFDHGDTVKTLSITHTCTCPFSWNVNVLIGMPVLKNTAGSGDNTQVPITIDRSMLTADTLHATLQITSNGYGTDTVHVTVLK